MRIPRLPSPIILLFVLGAVGASYGLSHVIETHDVNGFARIYFLSFAVIAAAATFLTEARLAWPLLSNLVGAGGSAAILYLEITKDGANVLSTSFGIIGAIIVFFSSLAGGWAGSFAGRALRKALHKERPAVVPGA